MYALVYHKNLLSIYNTNISLIGTFFTLYYCNGKNGMCTNDSKELLEVQMIVKIEIDISYGKYLCLYNSSTGKIHYRKCLLFSIFCKI